MQLVFHAGPLSEFMLLTPVLRALDRPLTVIAPWQRASLASHLIAATPMDIELFEFTRLHAEGGPSRTSPAVSDLFKNATQIISFLSHEQDAWADNVARLAPHAKLILTDPRPPASFDGHFTDWHLARLAEQGLTVTPIEPTPLDNPKGPIVVHPGSSAIKRCWPADRYEALILELKAMGHHVQPIFGEVELKRWSNERQTHWAHHLKAPAVSSTDALLSILSEAKLFIGNDAGPMHIASQIGTPVLAITGPTNPTKTAPRGQHVRLVGPPDGPDRIDAVTVETVIASLGLQSHL